MTYAEVDPALSAWANRHQLVVATEYKDSQVRSVNVTSADGRRKVQIWVDQPKADSTVGLHVWDYRDQRKDLSGPASDLNDLLELAYVQARTWLSPER